MLTSYLVANAIVLPLIGLALRRHRPQAVLHDLRALFTLSSALCGMATSLPMLVFFRVLQGIGGGGLQPSASRRSWSTPSRRPSAAWRWRSTPSPSSCAPVLGPTLGGWITDNYSWRWIFYINVPVGCLSLFLTQMVLHDPPHLKASAPARKGKPFRVDFIGLGLIALGLGGAGNRAGQGPGRRLVRLPLHRHR